MMQDVSNITFTAAGDLCYFFIRKTFLESQEHNLLLTLLQAAGQLLGGVVGDRFSKRLIAADTKLATVWSIARPGND